MTQRHLIQQQTILWVRHCGACGRIDPRDWFQAREQAEQRSWACPSCGEVAYVLLRTRW